MTMQLKTTIEGYLIFKASRASAETIKTDRSQLHQFFEVPPKSCTAWS